jgi:hypothetical protein
MGYARPNTAGKGRRLTRAASGNPHGNGETPAIPRWRGLFHPGAGTAGEEVRCQRTLQPPGGHPQAAKRPPPTSPIFKNKMGEENRRPTEHGRPGMPACRRRLGQSARERGNARHPTLARFVPPGGRHGRGRGALTMHPTATGRASTGRRTTPSYLPHFQEQKWGRKTGTAGANPGPLQTECRGGCLLRTLHGGSRELASTTQYRSDMG